MVDVGRARLPQAVKLENPFVRAKNILKGLALRRYERAA